MEHTQDQLAQLLADSKNSRTELRNAFALLSKATGYDRWEEDGLEDWDLDELQGVAKEACEALADELPCPW